MKRLLVVLTAVVVTTGCASTSQPGRSELDDVDVAYVSAVERAAQRFGTQIVWINYPRKRTSP